MNNTYAVIKNGIVQNVVEWDGTPYTPANAPDAEGNGGSPAIGWTPPSGSTVVLVGDGEVPHIGMGYSNGAYEQPTEPARSAEQIIASNTATRDALLTNAALAIAPLQDAIDLGVATDADTALLMVWKQYRVATNRVDLMQANATWPQAPAQ